jgi:hypothetical protein
MRATSWIAIAALAAHSALPAQELGVFATSSRPGPFKEAATGGGASGAAFIRLGRIFADAGVLSDVHVGFRFAVSELRGSQTRTLCYSPFDGPCVPLEPETVNTRLRSAQYSLIVLPYRSSSTRVELGAGMVSNAFRGDLRVNAPARMATVGLSRRLTSGLPLWAALGYEYHRARRKSHEVWPQDSWSAATPIHVARFGVLVRR